MASTSRGTGNGFGASNPSLFDADRPFAGEGVAPAGHQAPRKDDLFDDGEGPAAYSFSAPTSSPYAGRYRRSRWARFKEDYLTDVDWTFGLNQMLGRKDKFDGVPREVMMNDPEGNRVKGYEGNSVMTGNYGPITFLPKFLFCRSASR